MKLLLCALSVASVAGLVSSTLTRPAPAAAANAGAETYTVDGAHSAVVFHTAHLGLSRAHGRFNGIAEAKSKLVFDQDPAKSSILLVLEAASVDTGNPKRDEHLRNADFFSAKEFPEIVFESTKISGTAKAMTIEGELTFHGVTKSVQAKGQMLGSGEAFGGFRAGFTADLTIDMRDYAIEFLKKNPNAVGPEVHLTISLECVRK